MIIDITDPNLAAVVALEGLKRRRVKLTVHDETFTGLVTGVSESGLNVQDDETHGVNGHHYQEITRLVVQG